MPIFTPTVVTPPPPPRVSPDYGHAFDLIGADGSQWDLCGGPIHIGAGASGFGFPEPEHRWSDNIGAHGSRWRGLRFPRREMTVPLEVDGRNLGAGGWRTLETEFGRALDPRGEAALIVTSPEGVQRTIDFRYAGGGDDGVDLDPLRRGDSLYVMECVASEPFWRGVPVSVTAAPPSSPPTTVTNNGEVEGWPVWTVKGPFVTATLNVAGIHVTLSAGVTFPIGTGVTVTVDLNPGQATVRDQNGVLRWVNATTLDIDPSGIPTGTSSLAVSFSGATNGVTSARLDFETRYLRAWS